MKRNLPVFSLFLLLLIAGCSKDNAAETAEEAGPRDSAIWLAPVGASLSWQLEDNVSTAEAQSVYDIDAFNASAALVQSLHASGKKVMAYVSFGTLEDWQTDGGLLPSAVIGARYAEWPDERFINIREIEKIKPWITTRLDMIRKKGFDGVEPDNMDGYANATGFNLTEEEEVKFCLWLAGECHQRGLSIGQKNAPELVSRLQSSFDWALLEDAFADNFMDAFTPYIANKKAVFAVEYEDKSIDIAKFCAKATALQYDAQIKKRRQMNAYAVRCK
jgi:endo-alpha-1,4-polygalactosaminidase (GH114 family)